MKTVKMAPHESYEEVPKERVQNRKGMEGNLNRNHLRLISGLFLEDNKLVGERYIELKN